MIFLAIGTYQKIFFVPLRASWQQITDKKDTYMDKNTLLHYLRSPYNISVDDMRDARYYAADELERLYTIEEHVKELADKLEKQDELAVQN